MKTDVLMKRSNNFIARRLGHETVLVPINQTGVDVQKIYALNQTASRVWELLELPRTIEALVELLQQEFSADDKVIKQETTALVDDFLKAAIVVVGE